MIIATPISHLFKDKNKAEKIIKFSDCLEVRERNLGLDFDKEYLIHLDGDIHFKWDQNYKNYLKKIFKRKKKLKLISLQMTRCCTGHVIKNNFFQLSGKRLNKNDMKFNAKKNISWLKNLFVKKKINFAIENNNYYPLEAYDIIADPKFISEIVNENKINFLFDIAHAKVSASNMNIDFKKYIDELPMSKMIQIHICKPYISKKTTSLDKHNPPNKNDFIEIKKIFKKYKKPKYLTIEYYKKSEILINRLKTMKKILSYD